MIKELCNCPETWVKDINSEYAVSSKGRLKNVRTGRIITGTQHNQGYRRAFLEVFGTKKSYYIHRLVAKAFIPNPNALSDVDHISGVKHHNCVCNLQWLSSTDNKRKHNLKTYLVTSPDGETFTTEDIKEFCIPRGLNPVNLRNVANGARVHHKKWTAVII